MDIRNAAVEVTSDLYEAGRQDDGQPFIAEVYYVSLTLLDGTRFAHGFRFKGAKAVWDEEGTPYFEDLREQAEAGAEAIAARVRAAGVVDLTYWDEVDPAYGSEAYQREEFFIVAREKAEALRN